MAPETQTTSHVRARARAAYERGRFRDAAIAALFVVPLAVAVGALEHELAGCLMVGAALAVLVVTLHYRGGDLARGVVPGTLAGLAPLVLSNVVRGLHLSVGGSCTVACIGACSLGGLAAGVISAGFARRSSRGRAAWIAAAAVAAAVGALGCICVGLFGVVGLVAGCFVGAVPLVLRPAEAG